MSTTPTTETAYGGGEGREAQRTATATTTDEHLTSQQQHQHHHMDTQDGHQVSETPPAASQHSPAMSSPGGHSGVVQVDPNWTALPGTPPVEMKLFVGRVPRTADESVLRPLFSEFGLVTEIAIIKDKATNAHKGSAFVRMASITQADHSIRALNGQKVLDPALGPLQVRYATNEAEKLGMTPESSSPGTDQAKLFVGSLPKNATEEEVRQVFSKMGQIDEVFIMKDSATGQGKGCAFVKFAYKEQAIHAIKMISGQHQMPGAPRPLEVRFAESKRSSQQQQQGTGPGGAMQYPAGPAGTSQSGYLPNPSQANSNPRKAGDWKEYFTEDGRAYYHNEQTQVTQWDKPVEFERLDRQDIAGPPGANIFVFHVPNDWTQNDLIQNFSSFGQIVSARIATDKTTNRNRGYAFVSYANIHAAAQAVQHMNGFMAGSKRLKVSIKQNEEVFVQHLLGGAAAPPAVAVQPQPMMQHQPMPQAQNPMQPPYRIAAGPTPSAASFLSTAGSEYAADLGVPSYVGATAAPAVGSGAYMSQMPRYGSSTTMSNTPGAGTMNAGSSSSHRYAPY